MKSNKKLVSTDNITEKLLTTNSIDTNISLYSNKLANIKRLKAFEKKIKGSSTIKLKSIIRVNNNISKTTKTNSLNIEPIKNSKSISNLKQFNVLSNTNSSNLHKTSLPRNRELSQFSNGNKIIINTNSTNEDFLMTTDGIKTLTLTQSLDEGTINCVNSSISRTLNSKNNSIISGDLTSKSKINTGNHSKLPTLISIKYNQPIEKSSQTPKQSNLSNKNSINNALSIHNKGVKEKEKVLIFKSPSITIHNEPIPIIVPKEKKVITVIPKGNIQILDKLKGFHRNNTVARNSIVRGGTDKMLKFQNNYSLQNNFDRNVNLHTTDTKNKLILKSNLNSISSKSRNSSASDESENNNEAFKATRTINFIKVNENSITSPLKNKKGDRKLDSSEKEENENKKLIKKIKTKSTLYKVKQRPKTASTIQSKPERLIPGFIIARLISRRNIRKHSTLKAKQQIKISKLRKTLKSSNNLLIKVNNNRRVQPSTTMNLYNKNTTRKNLLHILSPKKLSDSNLDDYFKSDKEENDNKTEDNMSILNDYKQDSSSSRDLIFCKSKIKFDSVQNSTFYYNQKVNLLKKTRHYFDFMSTQKIKEISNKKSARPANNYMSGKDKLIELFKLKFQKEILEPMMFQLNKNYFQESNTSKAALIKKQSNYYAAKYFMEDNILVNDSISSVDKIHFWKNKLNQRKMNLSADLTLFKNFHITQGKFKNKIEDKSEDSLHEEKEIVLTQAQSSPLSSFRLPLKNKTTKKKEIMTNNLNSHINLKEKTLLELKNKNSIKMQDKIIEMCNLEQKPNDLKYLTPKNDLLNNSNTHSKTLIEFESKFSILKATTNLPLAIEKRVSSNKKIFNGSVFKLFDNTTNDHDKRRESKLNLNEKKDVGIHDYNLVNLVFTLEREVKHLLDSIDQEYPDLEAGKRKESRRQSIVNINTNTNRKLDKMKSIKSEKSILTKQKNVSSSSNEHNTEKKVHSHHIRTRSNYRKSSTNIKIEESNQLANINLKILNLRKSFYNKGRYRVNEFKSNIIKSLHSPNTLKRKDPDEKRGSLKNTM